ncbi:MAG TPA: hypothetical protein VLV83_12850 [Acidobacteriota bacterium]|nr:hypothetical protein [Acidobacteriota bacterium]
MKTVSATLPDGAEIKVSFFTNPANESKADNKAVGSFSIGAQLELKSGLTIGDTELGAGEYMVGALKKGEGDWTMAVSPGKMGPGAKSQLKLIELKSWFSTSEARSPHSQWDITPGDGKLEGKILLVWRFGNLMLAAELS